MTRRLCVVALLAEMTLVALGNELRWSTATPTYSPLRSNPAMRLRGGMAFPSSRRKQPNKFVRAAKVGGVAVAGGALIGLTSALLQGFSNPARGKVEMNVVLSAHHIRSVNAPTCRVVLVGNITELGAWNVSKGVNLTSNDDDYPLFKGTIILPGNTSVLYKYVIVADGDGEAGGKQQWEATNRPLTTNSRGKMTINNEFNEFRGTDPRVTDEPFQLTAQQWCRWFKHHQLPMLQLSGNYSGHLQTSEHDTVQL